jgi:pseudouridine synthase
MTNTQPSRGTSDDLRLQVVLARAGVASRRAAAALVTAGRVRVNGEVVLNASRRIDPESDTVALDGAPVGAPESQQYYALHKPSGVLSSVSDDRGRRTVVDLLPAGTGRCVPVGRLDFESEGLLLLTNDGPLITALLHPSSEVPREYLVEVEGRVSDATLDTIFSGVTLPDGSQASAKPKRSGRGGRGSSWLVLTLQRGRKHEVRLICAAVGHPVRRLIRVRFGPIRLRDLALGAVRPLTAREIRLLRQKTQSEKARTGATTDGSR